jgi:hypothetical protein
MLVCVCVCVCVNLLSEWPSRADTARLKSRKNPGVNGEN